jgi:hypothetical protein
MTWSPSFDASVMATELMAIKSVLIEYIGVSCYTCQREVKVSNCANIVSKR